MLERLTKKASQHNYVHHPYWERIIMELVCVKYNEKMDSGDAYCKHPGDYCKFRTSCIIHFIESERDDESDPPQDDTESEVRVNGKS